MSSIPVTSTSQDADDADLGKLVAPADFRGPTSTRRCTDLFCLGLLLCVWIALTAIGAYSIQNGDIRYVLYPLDYRGNLCGTSLGRNDMTNYSYLYLVNALQGGVCVEECPDFDGITAALPDENQTQYNVFADVRTMVTYRGIFQANNGIGSLIGYGFIETAPYYYQEDDGESNATWIDVYQCSDELCFPNASDPASSWTSDGVRQGWGYAMYAADSRAVLQRCMLTQAGREAIKNQTQVDESDDDMDRDSSSSNFWTRLYSDLYVARKYVLGFGLGASLGISIIYVFCLRLPAVLMIMVWASIVATIVMFIVGGWYVGDWSMQWSSSPPVEATYLPTDTIIQATRVLSIVLYVIAAVLAVLAICLRRQIQLAIACTKEAGRALNNMLIIFLVPVFQAVALCIFVSVTMIYAVYLASLGNIQINNFQGIVQDV